MRIVAIPGGTLPQRRAVTVTPPFDIPWVPLGPNTMRIVAVPGGTKQKFRALTMTKPFTISWTGAVNTGVPSIFGSRVVVRSRGMVVSSVEEVVL